MGARLATILRIGLNAAWNNNSITEEDFFEGLAYINKLETED